MLIIGSHLTISKGLEGASQAAIKMGANTFQFFTRNPRGGKAKALSQSDIEAYDKLAKKHQFGPVMAHGAYTMNLCSKDEAIRSFALNLLADDIHRIKQIPDCLYVFHPGSHTGQGLEAGINHIVTALNKVLDVQTPPHICLEVMSGKGTEIGSRFEEVASIIEGVTLKEKIGVVWDTCHLYSSGYDIKTDLEGVLNHFEATIGLEKLKAIHLNDSMTPFASHKDRHETIGQGVLGIETFQNLINHPKLKALPFYLETPNDEGGHALEIACLKKMLSE